MRTPKAVQIVGDVGALLVALAFPLVTFVLSLDARAQSVRVLGTSIPTPHVAAAPLTWLLAAAFCIALVEAVAHVLRANLAIDETKLAAATPQGDPRARQPLRGMVVTSALTTGLALTIAFALLVVVCASYVASNSVVPTVPTYVLLAVYALYLAARRWLLGCAKRILPPLRRWQMRHMPKVSLEGETVVVDLTPTGLRRRGGDGAMRIGLAEIEQAQMLTYREAAALRTYEIGPDLSYAKAHIENLYRFARGEIERPEVYLPPLSTAAPVLMLRGPKLLYLINVAEEPTALLAALNLRATTG